MLGAVQAGWALLIQSVRCESKDKVVDGKTKVGILCDGEHKRHFLSIELQAAMPMNGKGDSNALVGGR